MRFMSDNAASVHPKVWEALRAAGAARVVLVTERGLAS